MGRVHFSFKFQRTGQSPPFPLTNARSGRETMRSLEQGDLGKHNVGCRVENVGGLGNLVFAR